MKLSSCVFVLVFGVIIFSEGEEKYGCVLPPEPLFGSFEFNDYKRSFRYVCDENFRLEPGGLMNLDRKCRGGIWKGTERDCVLKYEVRKQCPQLYRPKNGHVSVTGLNKEDTAQFSCDPGFVMEGSQNITCTASQVWSGQIPVCSSRQSATDIALAMKEKFVDRYAGATATSKNGAEGRLSIGKSGLDVIIAVDTSSSIGINSLEIAKRFIKILVDSFGVSKDPAGGGNGTRFAVVTFHSDAQVLFNLDDPTARSNKSTKALIDKIQNTGGGTSLNAALDVIFTDIHLDKIMDDDKRKSRDTHKAIFLITDATQTVQEKSAKSRLNTRVRLLKNQSYEIFALGVGRNIDKMMLKAIASEPSEEHVFLINKFKDLKDIGDVIAERNIDYGKCGISGNTEVHQGTYKTEKGAWPWVGWFTARHKVCGGALLCDRYFMTSARCVSEVNETNHVIPYEPNEITLYLGDDKLFRPDDEEIMAIVEQVHLHENYTGEVDQLGIREYDIAILDLGENSDSRPPLNKFVKPICFPFRKLHAPSKELLKSVKLLSGIAKGFTVGWGLSPELLRELPWGKQKQNRREITSDKVCGRMYEGLDVTKYFCVGNIRKESDSCRGDIGGVYMAELPIWRYSALGIAQRTHDCEKDRHFSIFLDLHHPSITEWVKNVIGRCNRVGSKEDEEKEAEREWKELERKRAERERKEEEERKKQESKRAEKEEKERKKAEKERKKQERKKAEKKEKERKKAEKKKEKKERKKAEREQEQARNAADDV